RKLARQRVENADALGHGEVTHMGDQRIEARPTLGLEDARHGSAVGGVASQAVDRLGRNGDYLASLEQGQRLLHRLVRANDLNQDSTPFRGLGPHWRCYNAVARAASARWRIINPSGA